MKRPLFDVGITVLLGSAVVLYGNIYCYLLLPVLLAAAMFCAGRAADPRWRKAAVCTLSAAASILLMLSVSLSLESELKPLDGKTAEVTGVVTEKKSGNLYEAYGCVFTEAGSAEHIKFTLWNALSDELEAGDSFRCTARVTYDDPYTSEYRSSAGESRFLFCATGEEIELLDKSLYPVRAVTARLRAETSDRLIHALGAETGNLFSAITTGLRPGFDDSAQMMKDAGVYHVLSISGLHIAVFCHLILSLTSVLPLRRQLRNSLALLCLWCPVLISGGNHAVLRAAVMYSVLLFGRVIGRKGDSLNSLGIAVILLILMDPFAVLSYGFLLSVLATLGILLYERPLAEFLKSHLPVQLTGRVGSSLIHLFVCGISAQCLTLPILADLDSCLVLNGIMAGMLILPMMTPMLLLGYLLIPALWLFPESAGLLVLPARLLGSLFLRIAGWFSGLPFIFPLDTPVSRAVVLLMTLLLVVITALPAARRFFRPAMLAGASICCLLIAWEQWELAGSVQVISRGEDLMLLQDGHAVVLLADRDSEMLEELRRNGAEQIDLLIVENYAPLQAEGTLELLREYPPLQIAAPDSGAVTSYLEAVCDAPITSREQIEAVLPGDLQLRYQRGMGVEVSCGDILLLKFRDVYDIIKQYEPDVLLFSEQKAQVYRAGDIRVRENTAERTELLFWI